MIVIIDYKMGNIGSVFNMLNKIGADVSTSSNIRDIEAAEKLILPGVGAFDAGMSNLKKMKLIPALKEKVINQKTPILGICLGMQLFAQRSEEGESEGLGWIDANVKKFNFTDGEISLRVPHMGWNAIDIKKRDDLLRNLPREPRFYFAHSYHYICREESDILATANYGHEFVSIVRKSNIVGVQFHPEKSHKFGSKLLDNFVKLC